MIADVLRPSRNQVRKAAAIVGKQRAESFLESRQVARDGVEESIGRLLGRANTVAIAPGSAGLIPVAGQKRDLASDNSEAGAPPASCRVDWRLRLDSSEIQIDLAASAVKHQKTFLELIFQERRDFR
jgi:hypothetical protein